MCIMIPNSHPQLTDVKAAIEKAKAAGVASGKFTEANTKSANFKNALHNGTEEYKNEERPKHYDGHWYVNANKKDSQPGIVGPDLQPIMNDEMCYSGAWYNVDVNFYPFNMKSKGVGCGLNNVMCLKHGDRLDGRQNAEDAFAGLAVEAEDDLK